MWLLDGLQYSFLMLAVAGLLLHHKKMSLATPHVDIKLGDIAKTADGLEGVVTSISNNICILRQDDGNFKQVLRQTITLVRRG